MPRPLPFGRSPALVGVVHLGPLPGAPAWDGDLEGVAARAAEEAATLAEAGFDGIIVENFHDAPFLKSDLPPETVAALTRCALAARAAAPRVALGVNALRNDGLAALGVAVAVGASFIRVNVLTGAMLTDQGLVEGCAAALMRRRAALGARVAVLADVLVKHAVPPAPLDLAQTAVDTVARGGADALVVSGSGTGEATSPERLAAVRAAVPGVPVAVGSGVTPERVAALGADVYIVGTWLKVAGRIDPSRCRTLRDAVRSS